MAKYDNNICLIVDDYSTARRLIKDSLEKIGFSCFEAENGNQALAIIKQTSLNLVIADVMMPDKNGLELLKDIRADDNMKDLPVILTMLEPFDELISDGNKMGMNDYLVKPFDVFTLSKKLDNVIKTTVWLTDVNDFANFNQVYAELFPKNTPPARSTVCSALAIPGALVEIEAIAFLRNQTG